MRRLLVLILVSLATLHAQGAAAQAAPPAADEPPAPPPADAAPAADPNAAPAAEPVAAPAPVDAPAEELSLDPRFADSSMDNNIAVLGLFSFAYFSSGVGIGARYQKTIVPKGFLPERSIHDDFGIEGAFDFLHSSYDYGVLTSGDEVSVNLFEFSASAVWNLWFSPQFALYPRLGLGYSVSSYSYPEGSTGYSGTGYGGFFVHGGGGVVYKISAVTLRAEFSWRALGAGVGVTL